ncbi:MAG TPA: hypothetical protein H9752_05740 [Candidatus Phocaeicola excrementigallinarum]|nr:hypothetical protein [Candidatus Phocaeicola excrementigallinarum]
MKRNLVLLSGMFLTALVGCTDDVIDNDKTVDNPVKEGTEILFGSSVSTDVDDVMAKSSETRTVYGDRTGTGVPVYWDPNGDEVAIFCAQASQPANRLVNYIVKPEAENSYNSGSVEKVNPEEAGLQWGSADEHRFYAFYPASAVKAADEDDQNGVITANIPENQRPVSWREGEIDGVKTYFGLPDMNNAYMYAFTTCKRSEVAEGSTIDLQFKNLVTVLDITVQGPSTGEPITVTNINVDAVDGKNLILTGDFNCNIRTAKDNSDEVTAECSAIGETSQVRNRISIPCYDSAKDDFIKLSVGEQLNVKAYLIPDDEEDHLIQPLQLQISVATLNGAAKKRTLAKAQIEPHKINRVRLDHLVAGGTNYWMSSLDKDIYLSELSIPGSKFSYLTSKNNAFPVYQGATISQQFLDGVRAFIVQVGARATYNATRSGDRPWYNYSYEYSDATLPIDGGNGQTLVNAINDIAAGLAQAETELKDRNLECAVVMLTYSGGGNVQVNFTGNPENRADVNTVGGADNVWMDAIEHELKDLSGEAGNRIYRGTIDANTTLDDVKGKIIFKVNYNTDAQANHMSADAGVPALFSRWMSNSTMTTVPLRYGSANPNVTANLSWMYHEATHVGSNTEITQANKRSEVTSVLQNSVDAYLKNTDHNIWYMVDAGGTFYDGAESNEGVIELTEWLNPIVRQTLQNRGQNAATGLVFFNFADKRTDSGVKYGTNTLIQTIIDNNFKFALRKK